NELELALDRAELFQGQGKRADAVAALQKAELLASEAAMSPDLGERLAVVKAKLDAEARDQEFVAQFEDIRLQVQSRVHLGEFRFSPEAAFPEIREALRQYGIEISATSPEQAAACVRGRPERAQQHLIAAFDECLSQAPEGESQARQWLLAALNASDDDPW